ncbi:MAG: DUF898 family protein [Treponema sp.]|nr:DUF898 family protein [Treponema sp.]
MFCSKCGSELSENSDFCPKCGTKVENASTSLSSTMANESYFDGGVFQRLGWTILGGLVTVFTLGICYPFAVCWLYDWEAKHTVIDGRRLKFTGSAGGLFGTWIICLLLTIVTLGIYGFYVPIKIRKWRESNTFFENEIPNFDAVQNLKEEKASYFDGGFWQLFGWSCLGGIITLFTLGICYPWAIQMIYSWEQRHKVYCKKRCTFDGTAMQLFGTWIVCLLLSIVTLGIYTWWIPLKIKKWQIKHTHLLENDAPAEEQENKGLTAEEIEAKKKDRQLKLFKWLYFGSAIVIMILLSGLPRHIYPCARGYCSIFDAIENSIDDIIDIARMQDAVTYHNLLPRVIAVLNFITLYCAIAMIVFTFVKIKIAERIKLALPIVIFLATLVEVVWRFAVGGRQLRHNHRLRHLQYNNTCNRTYYCDRQLF